MSAGWQAGLRLYPRDLMRGGITPKVESAARTPGGVFYVNRYSKIVASTRESMQAPATIADL